MICASCKQPIPESSPHPDPNIKRTVRTPWLECPACVRRKSDVAVRERQLQCLRGVVHGQGELKTAVISRVRHIAFYGGVDATWCKLEVKPGHKRGFLPWDQLDKADICAECRIEVRRAAQDAVAA